MNTQFLPLRLLLAVLLAGCAVSDPSPVAGPSVTPAASPGASPTAPTPGPSPSAGTGPPGTGWERIAELPIGSFEMQGIAGFDGGYVAIGRERTVLVSADARSWTEVVLPFEASTSGFGHPLDAGVGAIATNGRELLIVGYYSHEPCRKPSGDVGGGHDCPRAPISWVSDDGRTWRSSFPGPRPENPPGYVQGSEFLAAWPVPSGGWDAALGYWDGALLSGSGFWHSPDGTSWEPLDPLPVPDGAPVKEWAPWPSVHGAVADAGGDRLAWQTWEVASDTGQSSTPTTWLSRSPDGRDWSPVASFPGSGARIRSGLAPTAASPGPRLLAGSIQEGEQGPRVPAIWTSYDLATWTTAVLAPGPVAKQVDSISALVAVEAGYVAVGLTFDGAGAEQATWMSRDGTTWVRIASGRSGPGFLANGPAGLVGIGPMNETSSAVWRLGGDATAEEAALISRLPVELQMACTPRRADLPVGAVAGVECSPGTGPAERVGLYLFATAAEAERAHFDRLAAYRVARDNGSCQAGEPGEGEWIAAGLDAELGRGRVGCFVNEHGRANVRLTCGDGVYVGILGRRDSVAQLHYWALNGAQPPIEDYIPPPPVCGLD